MALALKVKSLWAKFEKEEEFDIERELPDIEDARIQSPKFGRLERRFEDIGDKGDDWRFERKKSVDSGENLESDVSFESDLSNKSDDKQLLFSHLKT